jgi:hypothetical protein
MINIPCHILPLFFLSFCCCFQGTKHRLRSHRCRQTISVYTASSFLSNPQSHRLFMGNSDIDDGAYMVR